MIRGRLRRHGDERDASAPERRVHRDRSRRADRDPQRPGLAARRRADGVAAGRHRRSSLAGIDLDPRADPGDRRSGDRGCGVAAVASPLVAWLHGHRVPRSLGARARSARDRRAPASAMTVMVVTGITGQGRQHHRAPRQRQGHDRRLAPGPRRSTRARPSRRRRTPASGDQRQRRRAAQRRSRSASRSSPRSPSSSR